MNRPRDAIQVSKALLLKFYMRISWFCCNGSYFFFNQSHIEGTIWLQRLMVLLCSMNYIWVQNLRIFVVSLECKISLTACLVIMLLSNLFYFYCVFGSMFVFFSFLFLFFFSCCTHFVGDKICCSHTV